jgi:predicted acyltransferase
MILVNNPGSWDYLYSPLDHAPWHGCTPTDLVFPFFLFAVGNAMAFVMPKFEKEGTAFALKKIIKRTLLIFLIGLFLNWCPFIKWDNDKLVPKPWELVRIMGVLQRIALCYFSASLLVYFLKVHGTYLMACITLLLYWQACLWLGNAPDPYSLSGYFGTAVDIKLLGVTHLYKGEGVPFDPEGLASTPAAIVQILFGYLIGNYIQTKGKTYEMLSNLFVAGTILVCAGYCWDYVYPITKKTWTSSYTVYTTGLATLTLAILIYLIEFKNTRGGWSKFFDVFGKNPLFIFVLSGFLPRVLALVRWVDHLDEAGKKVYTTPFNWFYLHVCKDIAGDLRIGSLVYALCMIAFYWSIVFLLDKNKIYIKV